MHGDAPAEASMAASSFDRERLLMLLGVGVLVLGFCVWRCLVPLLRSKHRPSFSMTKADADVAEPGRRKSRMVTQDSFEKHKPIEPELVFNIREAMEHTINAIAGETDGGHDPEHSELVFNVREAVEQTINAIAGETDDGGRDPELVFNIREAVDQTISNASRRVTADFRSFREEELMKDLKEAKRLLLDFKHKAAAADAQLAAERVGAAIQLRRKRLKKVLQAAVKGKSEAHVKEMFDKLDANKDGEIDASELIAFCRKCHHGQEVSQQAAKDMISVVDSDYSGGIGWAEFKAFIDSMGQLGAAKRAEMAILEATARDHRKISGEHRRRLSVERMLDNAANRTTLDDDMATAKQLRMQYDLEIAAADREIEQLHDEGERRLKVRLAKRKLQHMILSSSSEAAPATGGNRAGENGANKDQDVPGHEKKGPKLVNDDRDDAVLTASAPAPSAALTEAETVAAVMPCSLETELMLRRQVERLQQELERVRACEPVNRPTDPTAKSTTRPAQAANKSAVVEAEWRARPNDDIDDDDDGSDWGSSASEDADGLQGAELSSPTSMKRKAKKKKRKEKKKKKKKKKRKEQIDGAAISAAKPDALTAADGAKEDEDDDDDAKKKKEALANDLLLRIRQRAQERANKAEAKIMVDDLMLKVRQRVRHVWH